jgi:hypothetical protein
MEVAVVAVAAVVVARDIYSMAVDTVGTAAGAVDTRAEQRRRAAAARIADTRERFGGSILEGAGRVELAGLAVAVVHILAALELERPRHRLLAVG